MEMTPVEYFKGEVCRAAVEKNDRPSSDYRNGTFQAAIIWRNRVLAQARQAADTEAIATAESDVSRFYHGYSTWVRSILGNDNLVKHNIGYAMREGCVNERDWSKEIARTWAAAAGEGLAHPMSVFLDQWWNTPTDQQSATYYVEELLKKAQRTNLSITALMLRCMPLTMEDEAHIKIWIRQATQAQ